MKNNHFYTFRLQLFFVALAFFVITMPASSFSQGNGEKIFTTICRACHTIGQGKLIGPDLANVQSRLKKEWIINFVKSSQKMVKKGDPEALRVFKKFNKIIMPDQVLTNKQILSVLNYIKIKSVAGDQQAEAGKTPNVHSESPKASPADIDTGRKYFAGLNPFKNGGPACLSCHNVVNDKLHAGGRLGKDLTRSISRLSNAGVDAIISNPPFPIMKAAFSNKTLTKNEKQYLLAFLQQADVDSAMQKPVNYQQSFVFEGLGLFAVLFVLFALIWSNRKKESVKKDIFSRQLKSY